MILKWSWWDTVNLIICWGLSFLLWYGWPLTRVWWIAGPFMFVLWMTLVIIEWHAGWRKQ
jgi:hypothetical protein